MYQCLPPVRSYIGVGQALDGPLVFISLCKTMRSAREKRFLAKNHLKGPFWGMPTSQWTSKKFAKDSLLCVKNLQRITFTFPNFDQQPEQKRAVNQQFRRFHSPSNEQFCFMEAGRLVKAIYPAFQEVISRHSMYRYLSPAKSQ